MGKWNPVRREVRRSTISPNGCKYATAQVRELVVPAYRGDYIVYDHLRRWDP